jgi:hypothetical protein
MLSLGGKNCDWVETFCVVPEGQFVGEWMVLLPWQRDFLYQIYNNFGDGSYLTPEMEFKLVEFQILKRDVPALELAMEQCRALKGRATQLDKILKDRPWWRTALLGCYIMQARNLDLKTGEVAPCWVIDPNTTKADEQIAAKLVRKLLKAGISQCHPDPMAALKAAANGQPAD